jgi:hypothetical protein
VTFDAALAPLVLDGKVLPFLYVAQPIEVVGKTIAVNPKVFRDHELSGYKDYNYQSDSQPQRA